MKREAISSHGRNEAFLSGGQELILPMGDYVRLRALAREHELADELDRAIVVSEDRIPKNVVTMHSRLVYSDESTGARREVELVYPDEADPQAGRISVLAPVGCALLGLTAGQTIDWAFPGGKIHRLRVDSILFQPRGVAAPASRSSS